jgi:hypothetical protein
MRPRRCRARVRGMNSTPLISPSQASERPSFGDELSEFLPYVAAVVVLAPITLLSLVLWAPFLLLFALVAVPVAVAALLGLVVALLAMPFVLLYHRHQDAAERRRSQKRMPAIRGAVASAGGAR